MTAILLAVALVVYNNLANRQSIFHGWGYLPMNLVATAAALGVAVGLEGLAWSDLGIDQTFVRGVAAGIALGLIPIALALPMLLRPRGIYRLADARMRHINGAGAVYLVLLRIPLGTAFTEEVAFRGVLPALFQPMGTTAAVLASSLAFGLWHIMPGINRHRTGNPHATRRELRRAAVLAVASTAAAGVLLCWIRIAAGNLGVPFGIHAAVNSGGALLAMAAWRRLKLRPGDAAPEA